MPSSKFLVFMVYKFRDHSPYFTISERMFQELLYRGCTLRHTIASDSNSHAVSGILFRSLPYTTKKQIKCTLKVSVQLIG